MLYTQPPPRSHTTIWLLPSIFGSTLANNGAYCCETYIVLKNPQFPSHAVLLISYIAHILDVPFSWFPVISGVLVPKSLCIDIYCDHFLSELTSIPTG